MKVLGEVGFDQTVTEIKKLRSKVSELQQIIDNSEIGMGYIDCTYAEALELANNEKLNAGYRYRINDYEPCVRESIFVKEVDKENKVKIYPFLTALSASEFDRNCTFQVETKYQGVVEVSGQYSFNNYVQANGLDELLMTWVDPENHKGVITRIDSPIGKIPFDYYNIQMRSNPSYNYQSFDTISTNHGLIAKVNNKYFAIGLRYNGSDLYDGNKYCAKYGEWTERESLSVATLKSDDQIFISADNKRIYMGESGIDPNANLEISDLVVGSDLAKYYVGRYLCNASIDTTTHVILSNPRYHKDYPTGVTNAYLGSSEDYRYFYLPDIITLPDTLDSLVQIYIPNSTNKTKFIPDKNNKRFIVPGVWDIEFHEPLTHGMSIIDAANIKSMSYDDSNNSYGIGIRVMSGSGSGNFTSYTIGREIVVGTRYAITGGKYFWVYGGHAYYAVCEPDDFIKQSIPANELQPGVLKLMNYHNDDNLITSPQTTITLNHDTKYSIIRSVTQSDGTPNTIKITQKDSWLALDAGVQPYGLDLNYPDCSGGQYQVEDSYATQQIRTDYKLYLPKSTVGYWPSQSTKTRNYLGIDLKTLDIYKPESGECEVRLQNGNTVKTFSRDLAYKLHEWLGCENIESINVAQFDYGSMEMVNIQTLTEAFHANLPRDKRWRIELSRYMPINNGNKEYGYTYYYGDKTTTSSYRGYSDLPKNINQYHDYSAKFVLNIYAVNVDDPQETYTFTTDITFDLKCPDID